MSGSKESASKTRDTNIRKYGIDFYSRNGKLGGKAECSKPKGFAAMSKERLLEISRKGGISKGISYAQRSTN